jgi:hypothetical protein
LEMLADEYLAARVRHAGKSGEALPAEEEWLRDAHRWGRKPRKIPQLQALGPYRAAAPISIICGQRRSITLQKTSSPTQQGLRLGRHLRPAGRTCSAGEISGEAVLSPWRSPPESGDGQLSDQEIGLGQREMAASVAKWTAPPGRFPFASSREL